MFDVIPVTSSREMDCGPTCLKMLLAYYRTDVPLDDLIRECNVTIGGCSAGDLNRAGTAHGLDMKAFRMDAVELIRQDRPAIVWWKYGHFCVFCGCDEVGKVVIANPDLGMYRMSAGMFSSLYSGVALFNGDPEDLPEPVNPDTSDLAEAAMILLGVSE